MKLLVGSETAILIDELFTNYEKFEEELELRLPIYPYLC